MDIGNNGVPVRGVLMNTRAGCVCIYPKFSLEAEGQQSSYRSDGTHVKDMKGPVKIQPLGDHRFLVVLRVIKSRDRIPFTPLDDVPLDLVHSPD